MTNTPASARIEFITDGERLQTVVFRMRLFSVSDRHDPEIARIMQLYGSHHASVLIENVPETWLNENSIIGVDIELLHFRWNDKFWSKWCYPWHQEAEDMKYLKMDSWFMKYFNSHCFGINNKYYVLSDDKNESVPPVITKCIFLSKKDDIMIQILSNHESIPSFVSFSEYVLSLDIIMFDIFGFRNMLSHNLMKIRLIKLLKERSAYTLQDYGDLLCLKILGDRYDDLLQLLSNIIPIPVAEAELMEDIRIKKMKQAIGNRREKKSLIPNSASTITKFYYHQHRNNKLHKTYQNKTSKFKYHRW